ncbi:MAG: indole-3-glycerol phosphate synthase TrpC [Tepidisphaeraceae bacterium]
MSGVLDRIVESKRREVDERRAKMSLDEVKQRAKDAERPRNFYQAVAHEPRKLLNVIAEVKRASPSAGVIKGDFDAVAIARAYEEAGADAISCLTDEPYFQGKLEYVQQIKNAVKLPVLRKDFIIDEWQVYESRMAGADAILLIAECLQVNEMIDLQILATELNLTTLIEVHSIENLMRVRDNVIGVPMKSYSLLGINNRDLQTMEVSVSNTLRMVEFVENKAVLVSESGIQTRQHTEKLAAAGVNAVLIGETLMRSGDVAGTMRELFARRINV